MPSRNLPRRIQDILEITAEIESFIAGMSFTDSSETKKSTE
ncbi:MAG: hypothetical protein QNJ55_34840 [Xenococcus sp. MO_188.B8]|nr:hypothetical protein [Xenococcus sp. MO_188.B8]